MLWHVIFGIISLSLQCIIQYWIMFTKIPVSLSAWTCTFHCLRHKWLTLLCSCSLLAVIVTWSQQWAGKYDLPNIQDREENSLLVSTGNAFHMTLLDLNRKAMGILLLIFISLTCLLEQPTPNRSSKTYFLKYSAEEVDNYKKIQQKCISYAPKWTQKLKYNNY